MNIKSRSIIKGFSYTLTANIISLIISVLVVLILPKIIGVKDYGYCQLYLFYSSYVGFLQFGWNDGIYLRYGGAEYNNLDKRLFFSQFWMLAISQVILACIILFSTLILGSDVDRQFVLGMVSLCTIILGTRAMLTFVLQATNRIKEYSQIIMVDRILYCCLIAAFMIIGIKNYKILVSADLIGKFISLIYAMLVCKEIVFRNIKTFYLNLRETTKNINVGIKLMFANIASMLIIGVVRFGIERSWDISTFGKISLTLNISNFTMLFINAVGIVIYPVLRRSSEKRLPNIYLTMRDFLMAILLAFLILYFPLNIILSSWLPKYSDSLKYMALLFPMCVYEGKMSLLINTFLKALRKETLILKINLISLTLSLIITLISTITFKNLNLAVLSIVILLAFRCILAEIYLAKVLNVLLYKDIVIEFTITLIFILIGWFEHSWVAFIIYAGIYVIYLVIKQKDTLNAINYIKALIKS